MGVEMAAHVAVVPMRGSGPLKYFRHRGPIQQ